MKIELFNIDKVIPYISNPRKNLNVDKVASSIREFGFQQPLVVDESFTIIVGHTRFEAAKKLGLKKVPVVVAKLDETKAKAYRIADNRLGEDSDWDIPLLNVEIEALKYKDFDLDILGFDDQFLKKLKYDYDTNKRNKMTTDFIVPPFSVLDAKQGYWQDRKREWINLGIKSEDGRGENLLNLSPVARLNSGGTSIFDPVLCEILIKWFSAKKDIILDPFAGGSVRGIVSSICERNYIGIDISKEQIQANLKQVKTLCNDKHKPQWIVGNSLNIKELVKKKANMILSCPPYHDLEKYTDDKKDLSNLSYKEFCKQYEKIIKQSCDLLEDDSFACWVVGEIRYKTGCGHYKNFISNTIKYFQKSGLTYYNEMVLLTTLGSLPIRAGRLFRASRKIGKVHQNILIFLKGDIKKAVGKLNNYDIKDTDYPQYES